MRSYLNISCFFNNKMQRNGIILTFNAKNCILEGNAKIFCFETNQMAEWNDNGYFFEDKNVFSRFFRTTPLYAHHVHCCKSSFKIFSNGKGKRRREECLKSKMAEKYNLNITMIVCQIEKWHKYIRYWFPLKYSHYLYLYLYLYLQLKQVRVRKRLMLMPMIILKREVI